MAVKLTMNPKSFFILVFLLSLTRVPYMQAQEPHEHIWTRHKPLLAELYLQNGKTIVTAGKEYGIRFWNIGNGSLIKQIEPSFASMIPAMAVSPNGRQLAASVFTNRDQGKFRFKLNIYDLSTYQLIKEIALDEFAAISVKYAPDGSTIFVGCKGNGSETASIKAIESQSGRIAYELRESTTGNRSWAPKYIDISPDGKLIAATGTTGSFQVWKTSGGAPLGTVTVHQSELLGIAFTPNGKSIVTFSGSSAKLGIFSVENILGLPQGEGYSKQVLESTIETRGEINNFAISPDGKSIAVGSAVKDYNLLIFDLPTGELKANLFKLGKGKPVNSLVFSPNGDQLAVGVENSIETWDLAPYKDLSNARKLLLDRDPALKQFIAAIEARKQDKFIKIRYSEDVGDDIFGYLRNHTNLEHLHLIGNGVVGYRGVMGAQGISVLDKLPSLTELTLSNLKIANLIAISKLKHLTKLRLDGMGQVEDWSALKDMRSLDELDLSDAIISDSGLEQLSNQTRLKRLSLNGTQFIDRRFVDLFSDKGVAVLEGLTNLEQLRLEGWSVTHDAGKHLRNLVKLRELDISRTDIHDGCSEFISELSQLESLSLGHITSTTIRPVTELPHLKSLRFDGTRISTLDLELLLSCKKLTELTIDNFWLPEPAITFMQRLPSMPVDERVTYDWIRLLKKTKEAVDQQASDQEYLLALGVYAPADSRSFSGSRLSVSSPSHPRHSEYMSRLLEFKDAYDTLNSSEVSMKQRLALVAAKARASCNRAFETQHHKKKEMEELIREFEHVR